MSHTGNGDMTLKQRREFLDNVMQIKGITPFSVGAFAKAAGNNKKVLGYERTKNEKMMQGFCRSLELVTGLGDKSSSPHDPCAGRVLSIMYYAAVHSGMIYFPKEELDRLYADLQLTTGNERAGPEWIEKLQCYLGDHPWSQISEGCSPQSLAESMLELHEVVDGLLLVVPDRGHADLFSDRQSHIWSSARNVRRRGGGSSQDDLEWS